MTAALASSSPSAIPSLYGADYALEFGTQQAANPCRYWPCDLLSAFMLEMAAHGHCVNESMMLGSRDYAIEKLNHAHTLGDDELRQLAVRMFSYFDDEPCHAVAQLVGASLHH